VVSRLRAVLTPRAVLFLLSIVLAAWLVRSMTAVNGETELEERIAKTHSSIPGAGEVSVVIATRSSPLQATAMGFNERHQEQVPCGAVAVMQGAGDPWIQAQITDALCTLLGLPASAVSVISGGG